MNNPHFFGSVLTFSHSFTEFNLSNLMEMLQFHATVSFITRISRLFLRQLPQAQHPTQSTQDGFPPLTFLFYHTSFNLSTRLTTFCIFRGVKGNTLYIWGYFPTTPQPVNIYFYVKYIFVYFAQILYINYL